MGWNLRDTLRPTRTAKGLTQEELARRARMLRTDVNRIENGKLQVGAVRLDRLAEALEVTRLELVPEAEADGKGQLLHDRLEALEANAERDRQQVARLIRAVTLRLAAIEAALEPLAREGAPPSRGGTGQW